MKVLRRSNIIYNQVFFVILSLVYLHILFSLDADITALNLVRFLDLVKGSPELIGLSVVTIIAILLVRKLSIFLLTIFTLVIFYKSFSIYIISNSKLILLLNVVYMISSYNMILLLKEELSLAIYKPNFSSSSLEVENYKQVKAHISHGTQNISGYLTNIDKDGFVIKLDDNAQIRGRVDIIIPFEGTDFYTHGIVATKFEQGYGIKLVDSKKEPSVLGWKELYNIFYKRGYSL